MIKIALAALLIASPAAAEVKCFPMHDAFAAAAQQWGEKPAFTGTLGAPGERQAVLVITLAPDGSWSVWNATDARTLCLLESGRDWAPIGTVPTSAQ